MQTLIPKFDFNESDRFYKLQHEQIEIQVEKSTSNHTSRITGKLLNLILFYDFTSKMHMYLDGDIY